MNEEIVLKDVKLSMIKVHPKLKLCVAVGNRSIRIFDFVFNTLTKYIDSDKQETYTCCDFLEGFDRFEKVYFLCLGGESGLIKIINLQNGRLYAYFRGHTGSIRDIKTFDNYIISCSDDSSIRVWDIKENKCAVVMGGILGHRDRICSVDVNKKKTKLLSGGHDFTFREWDLKDALIKYNTTKQQQFLFQPLKSYEGIHKSIITKVAYYGDIMITLSNDIINMTYGETNNFDLNINRERKFFYNDFFFLGNINMYEICSTFKIIDNVLVGLGKTDSMFLFNLLDISEKNNVPYIIRLKGNEPLDFDICQDDLFVLFANRIYRVKHDLTRYCD
ncbi:EED [Hepatospora eriocheir]|uniref:EED n=1 Tax=Hepatospora eriocheir TaxID=1081669 RepID=A0A1X0QIK9_9MICR|nr:EED [Hepatospora eriocheir]